MADNTLNIVILGASFSGISAAHHILDHTIPKLQEAKHFAYRVIAISPSTHLYWNISAPRALVSTSLIPHEASFIPIADGFKQYSIEAFQYIQGMATGLDTRSRTVQVSCPMPDDDKSNRDSGYSDGSGQQGRKSSVVNPSGTHYTRQASVGELAGPPTQQLTIPYHALIIATGSTAHSPLLSLRGPHYNTRAALDALHKKLPTVNSIIVAGGGPSGIETAGQLAYYYNRGQHKTFWSRSPDQKSSDSPREKEIVLLAGSARLLPNLQKGLGPRAAKQLAQLGVHVVTGVRVISASVLGATGKTTLKLSDGTTRQCDLYIPCTGVTPNTQFLPEDSPLLRDGYIATTPAPSTLRVDVPAHMMPESSTSKNGDVRVTPKTPITPAHVSGTSSNLVEDEVLFEQGGEAETADKNNDKPPVQSARVYALGDCAAYSANCVLDIYAAIPVLLQNLLNDLLAHQESVKNPYGGNSDAIAELQRQDAVYVRDTRDSQLVPIGGRRPGGVGAVFGHRVPSLGIYFMKGKDYRVSRARGVVEAGVNPYGPPSRGASVR